MRAAVLLSLLLAALGLGTAARATAQSTSSQSSFVEIPASEVWERNLYKTATYELMANGFDVFLYGAVLGGTAAAAPAFLLTNAALSTAAYYSHETTWDLGFDDPRPLGGWTLAARTVSYRVVSTAKNYALGLMFTADPMTAAGFAAISAVADVSFYLINDVAWDAYWPLWRQVPTPRTIDISY